MGFTESTSQNDWRAFSRTDLQDTIVISNYRKWDMFLLGFVNKKIEIFHKSIQVIGKKRRKFIVKTYFRRNFIIYPIN